MHPTNLGSADRACNLLVGAGLLAFGLTRASALGMIAAGAGAVMLQRGATGYCGLYKALGINTKEQSRSPSIGEPAARRFSPSAVAVSRQPHHLGKM